MCLNPINVPNPNYNRISYRSTEGQLIPTDPRLFSRQKTIQVPCGHCADCRNTYFNSILQRCLVESRSSYMYFVTLTYDNKHIPCITLPTGESIYYSDYTHIQNLFKRFRRHSVLDRDFRYISVTEYGTEKHRPHHHLLIFVSKKDTDTSITPYNIESLLWNNLQYYYADNKGSLRVPKYECLFTYKIRYTSAGVKTNYFVKYVDTSVPGVSTSDTSDTLVKTIRYLIGYINKSSAFDTYVGSLLEPYKTTDPILFTKLSSLLRSRVRFSKGLGFGFINGQKHILSPSFINMSQIVNDYTTYRSNLPSSFEDFRELYPDLAEKTIDYLWSNRMRDYTSLSKYLDSIRNNIYYESSDDIDVDSSSYLNHRYLYHIYAMIYFPKTIKRLVHDYYYNSHLSTPTISYLFNFCNQSSTYSPVYADTISLDHTSPVIQYIRSFFPSALKNKLPFLPFFIPGTTPTYQPLCSFYKRYCTNVQDTINMYDSIGCTDFDHYQTMFEEIKSKSLKREDIRKSNEFRDSLSEDIIFISQNIDVILHQQKDLFTVLFTNK